MTEHTLLFESLEELILRAGGFCVGRQAHDLREAGQLLHQGLYDLALVDWLQLPDLECDKRGLFPNHPSLRVILMTMDNDLSQAKLALDWGARGLVTEHDVADELLPALSEVLAGGRYLSRELMQGVSVEERASLLSIRELARNISVLDSGEREHE